MKNKVKRIKTIDPETLMKKLGKMVEESIEFDDEEYWYDRIFFMKSNYDNDSETYKSNDVKDKVRVLNYGLETISVLINQILRFNRIVYSTDSGQVYNFPKNETPEFYLKDIFSKKKTNTIKERMRKYNI